MVWSVAKINFQLTLICFFFIGLLGCSSKDENDISKEDLDAGLVSFEQVAPVDMLPKYKAAAHHGNGAAANSLSTFYLMADKDGDDDLYWTMISAENGDAVGQYNLAMKYLNNDFKYYSVIRARFWLEKAAKQGDRKAEKILGEMKAR